MEDDNFTEDVCKCCGKCCHNTRKVGRFNIRTRKCVYLDEMTNLCTIYDIRKGKDTGDGTNICVSVIESIHLKTHPEDCPYIKVWEENTGKKYKSTVMKNRKR